jgi:hypothetical protein
MESIPKDLNELVELLKGASSEVPGEKFPLTNRQAARVSVERREHLDPATLEKVEDEYPRAYISLEVPRVEQAIIAAVTALRYERVEKRDMLKVHRQLPAARWTQQALEGLAAGEQEPEEPSSASGATLTDAFEGFRFMLADELIKHYRPDFEDMAPGEQSGLVIQVLERSGEFMEALRRLALTIQHAEPREGLLRSPIKEADRDVRAAELRDIDELSYVEIGKRLGVSQSKYELDVKPYDNHQVRKHVVPNGRAVLKAAWGQDGYARYVESSKVEKQRRRTLSKEELQIERFAEISKYPLKKCGA